MNLLKRCWKRRDGLAETAAQIPCHAELEILEKIVEIFKTQMRDKIEIEEATRRAAMRECRVDFRHAPVHILRGDPRTNDAYPMHKADKGSDYSSLANCVLQMLLAAEGVGPGHTSAT